LRMLLLPKGIVGLSLVLATLPMQLKLLSHGAVAPPNLTDGTR